MADTLAQLVRSKYPGSYTDISDEELEAKIEEKYPGAYSEVPRTKVAAPPKEETPFPTPGETMGRMGMSALKAIPGIVKGTAQGAWEAGRMMSGFGLSEGANEEMQRHIAAAAAPGADLATRASEGIQALPMVGPMAAGVVKGGQEIVAPLAKTMVSGVGTVTPEEMNTAADTGGAAIAGLALPELAKGVPAVAGKMPGVGKLLKFAPPAVVAASGHPWVAAKMLVKGALTNAVLEPLGTIITDQVLAKIAARDVEGASAALAKGLEKSPKAAEALAAALEEKANAVAPAGAPTFSPTDSSPAAVAARNAAKRARLGRPPADAPIVAPEPAPAPTAPAAETRAYRGIPAEMNITQDATFGGTGPGVGSYARATRSIEQAKGIASPAEAVARKLAPIPERGNVKPATIYSKPGPRVKPPAGESEAAEALAKKQGEVASPDAIRAAFGESPKGSPHARKGPSGAPLTAAERREALIKLQESIASGQDIFASFGITPSR